MRVGDGCGCPTQAVTPPPFPPRGQGGRRPLRLHTRRIVLQRPGRKDFLHPGQGMTGGIRLLAAHSHRSRAQRLRCPAKPHHLARSKAAVAMSPPRPPWLLASTHLAGTLLLRSDLTARPRQPGTAGSVVVGVPQQHPGRAGGCGHAGGPGCSLEAWGPQGRWARWGPRASSGQDRGGRREPGLRPRQRRGPGAAFPFPFSPRRRGEAGGGALPEPHGGLEEEPLPRQQLRASFTPENGVQSCCHSPTARGTAQDPHSSHVSIGSRSPSSGRTPVSLHLHAATPSKGRDGDETTPKCWGTTGQVGTRRALSLSCSGLVVALFTPQLCPRATLNM